MRAVDDAANHPAVAVNPDELHHARGGADDFATPRAVPDDDFGRVLAKRVGELAGHLAPQAARLGCGVRGDGETTVGCDNPHRARHSVLGQLDLQLAPLRHGDQHRAQIESGQLRDGGVVEVVDVERAVQLVQFFGVLLFGSVFLDGPLRFHTLFGWLDGRVFAVVFV